MLQCRALVQAAMEWEALGFVPRRLEPWHVEFGPEQHRTACAGERSAMILPAYVRDPQGGRLRAIGRTQAVKYEHAWQPAAARNHALAEGIGKYVIKAAMAAVRLALVPWRVAATATPHMRSLYGYLWEKKSLWCSPPTSPPPPPGPVLELLTPAMTLWVLVTTSCSSSHVHSCRHGMVMVHICMVSHAYVYGRGKS